MLAPTPHPAVSVWLRSVRSWLLDNWVMRRLAVPPDDKLEIIMDSHLRHTMADLAERRQLAPERAMAALQSAVAPNVQVAEWREGWGVGEAAQCSGAQRAGS